MKRIAIIGGGASGLAAAVAAGEVLREVTARYEVVIYEADERVGHSILATGNGRCNFSNTRVSEGDYRNAKFVAQALTALQSRYVKLSGDLGADLDDAATCFSGAAVRLGHLNDARFDMPDVATSEGSAIPENQATSEGSAAHEDPVHAFFADLGLVWREESDGRCYPITNKASTVLDVLRAAAAASGVREKCGCGVVGIDAPAKAGGRFTLRMADGAFVRADAVILACGGRAGLGVVAGGHAAADLVPEGFGFRAERVRPVLGPLKTDTHAIKGLDGVRVRCSATLSRAGNALAHERGELLFRSYGVSGIVVFDLSRYAQPGDVLTIDFLPDAPEGNLRQFACARLSSLLKRNANPTCEDFLRGLVLSSVARSVLGAAGMSLNSPCDEEVALCVLSAFKGFSLGVRGAGDARQCQVARGGLEVGAFCPESMEARTLPGFFVAGEALDVDAPCGGYNLHWAWASGILAGVAAAERMIGDEGGCA